MIFYKNKKIFAPLVAAIIITALIITIIFSLVSAILDDGFLGWAVIIIPFIFLFVLIHTVIGALFYLLLYKYKKENILLVILLGAMVGFVPSLLFDLFFSNSDNKNVLDNLLAFSEMAIIGVLGAIIFKVVWKKLYSS